MRNGDRVQAEVRDMGQNFSLRVNGQPRQVPIGDIVLIDFTGNGRDISGEELSRANAANGYIVMKNGETIQRVAEGPDWRPADCASSRTGARANLGEVVADLSRFGQQRAGIPAGGEQSDDRADGCREDRVGRGRGRGRDRDGYQERSAAPANARSVVVPSNVQWTNAGFNVSRGQYLRFEPSGEIRLSTNGEDVARAAGAMSGRRADNATIPSIPVGALIGRIGNGQPFVDWRHDERDRHARERAVVPRRQRRSRRRQQRQLRRESLGTVTLPFAHRAEG